MAAGDVNEDVIIMFSGKHDRGIYSNEKEYLSFFILNFLINSRDDDKGIICGKNSSLKV